MLRYISALLLLLCTPAYAAGHNDKDTLENTRYHESVEEKAAREFKEADFSMPAFPDTTSSDWFDLYIDENYPKQARILLDSLYIVPAPDNSIRYVLNVRSQQGYDNLSVESLFCARSSWMSAQDKLSSYKIFAYGDTQSKSWIPVRNAQWKPIGAALARNDSLRTVLYQTFCVDGRPNTREELIQRLRERAGHYRLSVSGRGEPS